MIKSIIWGEKLTLNVQIYECFINWVVKNCDGPYLGHDIPPFPFPQVIISADLIPFLEWPARRDREGWVAESPPPFNISSSGHSGLISHSWESYFISNIFVSKQYLADLR